MLIGDGGGGYSIPGDPGAIRAAVAQLRAVAGSIGHVQATTTGTAGGVAGTWRGQAASAFQGTARSTTVGLNTLATGATTAATVLATFATVLEQAQAKAAQATSALTGAGSAYNQAMQATTSLTGNAVTKATDAAQSAYTSAVGHADSLAASARVEVANAARIAGATLATVGGDISRSSLHEVADELGGPGTALSVLGLEQQGMSWAKIVQAYNAVKSVDPAKLKAADPAAFEKFEAMTKDLEDGDMNGLHKLIQLQDKVMDNALDGAKNAAVPGAGDNEAANAADLSEGGNSLLDTLGKVGFGLAIVGDVDTLFVNKDATGLDKGMAGANLAGIAAVEGGSQVAMLVGLNAAADAIPIVGEVVIAGTAIYFAQEWARAHWDDIKQWSADAVHGIEDAGKWTETQLNNLNDLVDHTITTGAKDLVHVGQQAADDIANAGSTVIHMGGSVAKTAVHDINPLNW
jgi:uncharacterized protein YukE